MITEMLQCPNDFDERIELYCLNRMQPAEAKELESHVASCPACLSELLGTDFFLDSLVSALQECEESQLE